MIQIRRGEIRQRKSEAWNTGGNPAESTARLRAYRDAEGGGPARSERRIPEVSRYDLPGT